MVPFRAHVLVGQFSQTVDSPSQYLPPLVGGGLVHARLLTRGLSSDRRLSVGHVGPWHSPSSHADLQPHACFHTISIEQTSPQSRTYFETKKSKIQAAFGGFHPLNQ
jgi:hypothetical protein